MGFRRPSLDYPERPVSLLVVEHAARALRRRATVFVVFNAACVAAMLAAGIPTLPWLFIVWFAPALRGLVRARTILRALDEPGATATRRGATITLTAPSGRHVLALTPDELASAREHALPAATL